MSIVFDFATCIKFGGATCLRSKEKEEPVKICFFTSFHPRREASFPLWAKDCHNDLVMIGTIAVAGLTQHPFLLKSGSGVSFYAARVQG